jgi:hypothetical protein
MLTYIQTVDVAILFTHFQMHNYKPNLQIPTAHKILQYAGMICQVQLRSGILFKRDLMFATQLSGHQNLVCEIRVRLVNVTFVLWWEAL